MQILLIDDDLDEHEICLLGLKNYNGNIFYFFL
jgi:hypothetical protein